jgi:hypothetical protein
VPTYIFKRKSTGETWEDFMSMSNMTEALKTDPDLDVIPTATPLCDPWRLGLNKTSDGFRDVLRTIKKNNIGSNIDVS